MKKIILFIGTRPEAIKLRAVVDLLKQHSHELRVLVCLSGQHKELLLPLLQDLDLPYDFELDLPRKTQSLSELSSCLFRSIGEFLVSEKPDFICVQGDTTTVLVASLCAFYEKIKVFHIEAGLRSKNIHSPFPEELNRKAVGMLADYHFAPTQRAKENLLREEVRESQILVSGNTVVDTLLWMVSNLKKNPYTFEEPIQRFIDMNKKIILITGHRRENFGKGFEDICQSIKVLAFKFPEAVFIYPVHLNPKVKTIIHEKLGKSENIFLLPPLGYRPFVALMNASFLILTDSGGIQEEAPSLGKPLLILRNETERPEAIEIGVNKLVGTDPSVIVSEVSKLIESEEAYKKMVKFHNPYGDGQASKRIADKILNLIH